MPKRTALALFACVVALTTDCGRDGDTEPSVPATVTVTPGAVTLSALGATHTLHATVRDQNGNILTSQGVTWTADDPSVATVSSSGVVTAVGNGTDTIRAAVGSVQGKATVTVAQTVSALAKASGDGQSGAVGAALPTPLVVRATDVNGHPVAGVAVAFAVTAGGGSLSATAQTTGASGLTDGATWTLGLQAGAVQQVSASAAGVAPVAFAATATAGAAAQMIRGAGDGQSSTVNAPVAVPPSVLVLDAFDNPVPDVAVTFTVTAGGGSVVGGDATTDVDGIAGVASWTLGTTAGVDNNTLQATAEGVVGSPITFTASATVGAPAQIAPVVGDGQTAMVNTAVLIAPSVLVRDAFDNPVPDVMVGFTVTAGGGVVEEDQTTTDADGVAAVISWTLGTEAGIDNNVLEATLAGVAGSPVTFTASATPDAASAMTRAAGEGQTATVNTTVAVPPSVLIRDQFGNPVPGILVSFAVTAGGGSVTGASATTNVTGTATVASWMLGTVAGIDNNTLAATAAGLMGSPVTFTASATPDTASAITLAAGDGQSTTVNTAVPVAPAVLVRDEFDNPVPDVAVTFAVTSGGGSVTGGSATTDEGGVAAVGSWTLGTTAGVDNNSLQATAPGLTSSPVTFTASATPGPPTQMALHAGDGQSGTVNTPLPIPPAVLVRDAFSNPVSGVPITFTVTSGGGSVAGGDATSDDNGVAAVTDWTLGTTAGIDNNSLEATGAGLAGSPVSFTASAAAGAATEMTVHAGDGQSASVNTAVAIAPSVRVRDQFDNPVAAVAVTFTVTAGGGLVAGGDATTDGSGVAHVTSWTLGTIAAMDNNMLEAASAGLSGSPLVFTASATAGPAATVAVQAGDGQSAPAGTSVPVAPAVIVRDAFTNPVPGAIVTFAVTAGGGSATAPVDTTEADGTAAVGEWILGAPGANEMTATVTGMGISGNPVTFIATATGVGAPASVSVFAGNDQTGLVGFAVNVAPAVIVRDESGDPLADVQVDFVVAGGGGSVTGTSALSGADGVARVGSWILGAAPGPNGLTATVAAGGVSGNPVAFAAIGAAKEYDIVVRYLTAVSPAAQEAFDSAEARWERLLYGELSTIPINRPPGMCAGVSVPRLNETVDDLLIFVRLDSIDGPLNVLGSAGPCLIRTSDSLPVVGAMQFDTADVATFVNQGLFDEIVMHEMGHVIGLGTLWSLKGRLQNPSLSGGVDPFFDGTEAIAAFDRSGGAGYSSGNKVPVENTGGGGTADAHWRESVFETELMTGFLNGGVANPLSVISVASMADIGYARANHAGADAYVVASPLLRVGAGRTHPFGPDAFGGIVTLIDEQGRSRGTIRLRE